MRVLNHQGWLLEISRHGEDLYPEIKRRAQLPDYIHKDSVRFEIMKWFGYYVTESSEHSAEYTPWFIKAKAPELIDRFHIPLDEYPARCVAQITGWDEMAKILGGDEPLDHERSGEYASYIFDAVETGTPYTFGGNVLNTNLITNLPPNCCVEVMCVADRNGVTPTHVGDLPEQCAALTRTNVNVQSLTIEAALTLKKEHIYQAALLDPHTGSRADHRRNCVPLRRPHRGPRRLFAEVHRVAWYLRYGGGNAIIRCRRRRVSRGFVSPGSGRAAEGCLRVGFVRV